MSNGSAETISAKYVFLDIVGYSYKRSVEAQTDIINTLNSIVEKAVKSFEIDENNLIFIPTGDGMCIAFLGIDKPFDIHILLSLKMLELLKEYNESQKDETRKFTIRIGVNENVDNLITDINGEINIAGAGITDAQRIMNYADGGIILVGQTVYDKLSQREMYLDKFRKYSVAFKHSIPKNIYQLVDSSIEYLNSEVPVRFQKKEEPKKEEPKFSKLVAYLMGHIIKNKEFIEKHSGGTGQVWTLSQLMVFLAKDSVGYSNESDFNPYSPKLMNRKVVPYKKFKTLEEAYNYFARIDICVRADYSDMFYDLKIKPYWGYKYFVPGSHYLKVTKAAIEKLKREWPDIVEELEISEIRG